MTKQSKQSIEQLFNIAKAVSYQVIKLPDREVLDEDNDSFTKSEGFMAKRAYLKALQTVGAKDTKQVEPKVPSFNLANTLMKGVSVKVARQKLMGLNAANDPSLQLIANSANLLNDEEILKTYQALLSAGLLDIG